MHAVSIAVRKSASHAIRFYDPARSLHSRLISSHRVRSTRITASTWVTGASFTMPVSRAAGGADQWRTFLLSVSRMAIASEFEETHAASILAQCWSERVHAWAKPTILS